MTRRCSSTTVALTVPAVIALATTVALTESYPLALATPVAVAGPVSSRRRDFLVLVVTILAGTVVGGVLGWGVAQVTAPTAVGLATIFGAAIGGGFAAVIRLFVFADATPQETESVTIGSESSNDAETVPDPEPIDLFEGTPDPILYFDDAGDGPVVRAANPAYAETFGVAAESVERAALGDALMVTARGDAIVAAAGAGERFDERVACETGTQTRPFRVRTVTIESIAGTRGYVLYTPVESSD
jgi:PAS domain-containing protein